MIIKAAPVRPIPSFLLPFTHRTTSIRSIPATRPVQQNIQKASVSTQRSSAIPSPTPFVPDTQTFLTLIGRNLSQHASKIPSWEALFRLSSAQLKELGVEPSRSRRYLLRWREKFRNGEYGVGGDLAHVEQGTALVKAVEVPVEGAAWAVGSVSRTPGTRKIVVSAAGAREGGAEEGSGSAKSAAPLDHGPLVPVRGLRVMGVQTIVGAHVQPVRGLKGTGKIVIREGLWEDRRGHKIDGGERRQAEVRAKRRGEERRAARERGA